MNVVVTGGGGYVGSVLVGRLLERGHCVRVVDQFPDGEGSLEAVADRIEIVRAGIGEIQPRWLSDVDAVVHLAGLGARACTGEGREASWGTNAVATERLAMACRLMRVPRFTYASTCDVYNDLPAGYEYGEEAPVRPQSPAAVARLYGERRLRQLADSLFCPVILRHAVPYGLSPRTLFEGEPNRFVLDAVSLGRVTLPADAWITRPFVGVEDLAEAHILCLEAPEDQVRGQVFNVVHTSHRIREVGSIVADVVGREGGYVRVTTSEAASGTRDCRCSPARLRDTLGFTPGQTLEAAATELARSLSPKAPEDAGPSGPGPSNPRRSTLRWYQPEPAATERISGSYQCSVEWERGCSGVQVFRCSGPTDEPQSGSASKLNTPPEHLNT